MVQVGRVECILSTPKSQLSTPKSQLQLEEMRKEMILNAKEDVRAPWITGPPCMAGSGDFAISQFCNVLKSHKILKIQKTTVFFGVILVSIHFSLSKRLFRAFVPFFFCKSEKMLQCLQLGFKTSVYSPGRRKPTCDLASRR